MRIDRGKISNEHMEDLERLTLLSCKQLKIGDFVVDLMKTSDILTEDMKVAQLNPNDPMLQKATVVKGVFECYDFLLRNKKLMAQMEGIFNHFENIPLIEEEEEMKKDVQSL